MIVAKFGGTSVSTKESVLTLCNIVQSELKRKPAVVVSALSGVTDLLASLQNLPNGAAGKTIRQIRSLHKNLTESFFIDKKVKAEIFRFIDNQLENVAKLLVEQDLNREALDRVLSYGEIMSSFIITKALQKRGIRSKQIIATNLIITNDDFGSAEALYGPTKRNIKKAINPLIKAGVVPVLTGFIGSTKKGTVTTLGRGGSDYTASIVGFCTNAEEIQIWTDVDGIMTADPKIVKKARSVDVVPYGEASELAFLGAKVLHPKTILPAVMKNIPVKILNTHNPTHKGTTILKTDVQKKNYITSIACKKGIKLIDIEAVKMFRMHGFLHKIFKIFDELAISVDFVSTSEISVSVTIEGKYDTTKLVDQLKKIADVEVKNNRATVSVVGKTPGNMPVIRGSVYSLIENKKIDIEMISAGASKVNETLVVKEEDAEAVVKIFHKTFFEI